MRTAVIRWLAAILTTMMVVGCGPQPEAFPAQTPEELKQLTDVTDRVVALVRSSDRDTARREATAAVSAANRQYRQHGEAIASLGNADALACISSYATEMLDLQTRIDRRDEAARRQDEVMAKRRTTMLQRLAMDSFRCAVTSTDQLVDREQRRDTLKHAAVVLSEIYAVTAILRTGADLPLAMLLNDQIRTYEKIAAKLGPKHASPLVTDALPKLKAALAELQKQPAHPSSINAI